jgi:hypothetical protein
VKNNHEIALDMISKSSLVNFTTALEWGQWCRRVALAAYVDDTDKLKQLKSEQDDEKKAQSTTV